MSRSRREIRGLEGVLAVLPTAFAEDGQLDRAGQSALVDVNVAAGVSGFVVLGVMGEAGELTERERHEVIAAINARTDGLPVVLGISAESATEVAERAENAGALNVTAVMVSPTRSVPLPAAVTAASRAGLPIVIQDYPAGSGVPIAVDEIVAAVESNAQVAGVKVEAPPTSGKIAALRKRLPDVLTFGGLGGLFLIDELRAGAAGTMTGFALPERLVQVVRDFRDTPVAAELAWQRLLPLMRFEAFPPLNLAARKEVWRLRGVLRSSHCRRAGAVLDEQARRDVRSAYESVIAGHGT